MKTETKIKKALQVFFFIIELLIIIALLKFCFY